MTTIKRKIAPEMTAAIVLACLLTMAVPAAAQWLDYPTPGIPRTKDGKPDLTAPVAKSQDGKPDLSGIWRIVYPERARSRFREGVGPNLRDFMPSNAEIPLQPAAAALYKQRSDSLGAGRPSQSCLPHGIPDAMLVGQFKLVQTPALTLILYEEFNHYRQILTDGRRLPTDLNPAWFGYSVGKWDRDALVVETAGFNDRSWIDDYGLPHTEGLHTTERFERRDFGHLDLVLNIDDPKAYTKSWSVTLHFELVADTELLEEICDNERDAAHIGVRK